MFKVRNAADHIWLEFYLACVEDRIAWRSGIKLEEVPDTFPALQESGITSRNIMLMGVEDLAKEKLLSIYNDEFDDRFVILTEEGFARAESDIGDPETRIGRIYESRKLQEFLEDDAKTDSSASEEDAWEPIVVDRSTATFESALSALELVRDQFRQENGFASQEPEKKAALVDAVDKGIDVLRSKVLTRSTLDTLVFKPLTAIIRIFGNASLGEAAKIAVGAIRTWLGW